MGGKRSRWDTARNRVAFAHVAMNLDPLPDLYRACVRFFVAYAKVAGVEAISHAKVLGWYMQQPSARRVLSASLWSR